MLWHDCVYRVALLCDKIWFCLDLNKVAVIENAQKCRPYPTFTYAIILGLVTLISDMEFFGQSGPGNPDPNNLHERGT